MLRDEIDGPRQCRRRSPAGWTWQRAGPSDSDPVKGWEGCCLEGEWRASRPPDTLPNAHTRLPAGFHPKWHQTYPTSAGKHNKRLLTCFTPGPRSDWVRKAKESLMKHWLTGGHWESLSAAIICTFRCLLWDLPLDLTSLCSTWRKTLRSTSAPH